MNHHCDIQIQSCINEGPQSVLGPSPQNQVECLKLIIYF
jgi:hypothetical protein